ncbi:hypothetical protein N9O57_02105 [bacterium]|nr:hypothetical protein [bacterium]
MMPRLFYFFLLFELLVVAFFDVTKKKIYNVWAVLNILAFFVATYFFDSLYFLKFESFIFSIVFLIVGLILYALKVMGPGDSKFLFSFFLLIPVSLQEDFFYCLCVITIAVGLSLLFTNLIEHRKKVVYFFKTGDFYPFKATLGKKFPFAPLILISWVWFGWRNYKKIL